VSPMSSSANILRSVLRVFLNKLKLYPAGVRGDDGTLPPIKFRLSGGPARWQVAAMDKVIKGHIR
jgi:hypothetical protein